MQDLFEEDGGRDDVVLNCVGSKGAALYTASCPLNVYEP